MTHHACIHREVEVADQHADEILPAGVLVLLPCDECGESAADTMRSVDAAWERAQAALMQAEPFRLLYHWTPTRHRKQIVRRGLVPGRRTVTHPDPSGWRTPWLCFADCPSWAWALSGHQASAPVCEWDLWQTSLDRLVDPWVEPSSDRPSGMHEVRTTSRVYKRDLWLIGSRTKERA